MLDDDPRLVGPLQAGAAPQVRRTSKTDRSSVSGSSKGSKQSNQRQGQTTGETGGNSKERIKEREKSQKSAAKVFEVCEKIFVAIIVYSFVVVRTTRFCCGSLIAVQTARLQV